MALRLKHIHKISEASFISDFHLSRLMILFRDITRRYIKATPSYLKGRRFLFTAGACTTVAAGVQGFYVRQKFLNRPEDQRKDINPMFPTSGVVLYKSMSEIFNVRDAHDSTANSSHILKAVQKFRDEIRDKKITDIMTVLNQEVSEVKKEAALKLKIVADVASKIKENLLEKEKLILAESKMLLQVIKSFEEPQASRQGENTRQPIKLTILGDSLVCGVGCDRSDSESGPVMPRILASILSLTYGVDVEWESHGIVGVTVGDIRKKLVRNALRSSETHKNAEHIVVIICGLNDWKSFFTQFPHGSGPVGFLKDLGDLIDDIKVSELGPNCKIFLPAMPVEFGNTDPNCSFHAFPLCFFVENLVRFWDNQKRTLMASNPNQITFISQPKSDALSRVSIISEDGIHSSQ